MHRFFSCPSFFFFSFSFSLGFYLYIYKTKEGGREGGREGGHEGGLNQRRWRGRCAPPLPRTTFTSTLSASGT